jgi:hypothetical protein
MSGRDSQILIDMQSAVRSDHFAYSSPASWCDDALLRLTTPQPTTDSREVTSASLFSGQTASASLRLLLVDAPADPLFGVCIKLPVPRRLYLPDPSLATNYSYYQVGDLHVFRSSCCSIIINIVMQQPSPAAKLGRIEFGIRNRRRSQRHSNRTVVALIRNGTAPRLYASCTE